MKIEYLDPKTLIPSKRNPRRHPPTQIESLKRVIAELGFDQPIVVDQNREVIKGHGRLEAALGLGLPEVPVVVRHISENNARFLRAVDNEVPSDQWDSTALSQDLTSLESAGFDLNITGFSYEDHSTLKVKESAQPKSGALPDFSTEHKCDNCGYEW